ncbi:hypothetical protein DMI60_18565 [Escherichia coli]|nr:hypothetical protein [Escherichia coli]
MSAGLGIYPFNIKVAATCHGGILRLAGEPLIVRVLNNFQPLLILCIFCMRGFAPPYTELT